MAEDVFGAGQGNSVERKAPRGPSGTFAQVLAGYKDKPIPDYLLIDKSEWLGDQDIPVARYISREFHDLEKERLW